MDDEPALFTDHREPTETGGLGAQIDVDPPARTRERRNVREQIETTYRDIWNEFYAWEPDGCQQLIKALACPQPRSSFTWEDKGALEYCWKSGTDDMPLDDDNDGSLGFTVLHLDNGQTSHFVCEEIFPDMRVEPHPKYESCTPSMRNIKADGCDDPTTFEYRTRFVPYAGEAGFDELAYLTPFRIFDWQDKWHDNDTDEIAAEAARRLVRNTTMTPAIIHGYHVLPQLVSSSGSDKSALLWRMKQRDPLHWPGYTGDVNKIPDTLPDTSTLNTWKQINEHVDVFCPNLSCIEAMCLAHRVPGWPLTAGEPHIDSVAMRMKVKQSCGHDCFLNAESDDDEIISIYTKGEQEMYKSVLELLPDETPCMLSYLHKIPCQEIFKHRCLLWPDDTIAPAFIQHSKDIPEFFYDDVLGGNKNFTPQDFCHHSGQCSRTTKCVCYKNGVHCRRNCCCSKDCKLHYSGCRCEKGCHIGADNQQKKVKDCKCRKSGRECDPELCGPRPKRKKGMAMKPSKKHDCGNMCMFKNDSVSLTVRKGAFGLGTFAQRTIRANRLIGEYIAEILPNAQHNVDPIQMANDYRGLNYAFDLNASQMLEGATVGNETRYINHSKEPEMLNVAAEAKYVNGEPRMALYSTKRIERQEELFLNYGEGYWAGHETHSE